MTVNFSRFFFVVSIKVRIFVPDVDENLLLPYIDVKL